MVTVFEFARMQMIYGRFNTSMPNLPIQLKVQFLYEGMEKETEKNRFDYF